MSKKLNILILSFIVLITILFEAFGFSTNLGASYTYVVKPMIWIVIGIISYFFFKNSFILNKKYKKQVDFCVVVASLIYFFIYFILGYVKGFAHSPYDRTLNGIITNLWSTVPIIIVKEYLRYYMITNCGQKKIFLWTFLISLLFTLCDLNFLKFSTYFSNSFTFFEFMMQTFIPSIIKSLFLTYVAYFSGFGSPILYVLLPELTMFVLPILPDIDWALASILNAIVPFFTYVYINYVISKIDRTSRVKVEKTVGIKGWLAMILIVLLVVGLGLGVFPVQPIVIGSNSMLPVIRKGDIVVVKKVAASKIKQGDIIRYVLDGNYIIHRVEKIKKTSGGRRIFITKGDNNDNIDLYPVKESQFAGIIKFTIPYVGYPTILLRELLNPNMGNDVKVEKGRISCIFKKLDDTFI